jgi:hypothetical protein
MTDRITYSEPNRNAGLRLPLLRPICWAVGHGIYAASGNGWSHTKLQCPRCGKPLDAPPLTRPGAHVSEGRDR